MHDTIVQKIENAVNRLLDGFRIIVMTDDDDDDDLRLDEEDC
jgi:hypothetical protein